MDVATMKKDLENQIGSINEDLKNIYLLLETVLILLGKRTAFRIALETLIPELKESEDERIIKTLQEYVKNRNWMLNGPTQKDCLAWLEKQKDHFRIVTKMVEQKPAEWSEDYREEDITLVRKALAYLYKQEQEEKQKARKLASTCRNCKYSQQRARYDYTLCCAKRIVNKYYKKVVRPTETCELFERKEDKDGSTR